MLAAPFRQSAARWQVLAAIEDQSLAVAQIARMLNLARQSVQRIVDLLAADGLASYEVNPAHARAKLLYLTGEGRVTLHAIQQAQVTWANAVGATLDPKALLAAAAELRNVREILATRGLLKES